MRTPVSGGRRRRPIVGFLIGLWALALVAGCGSAAAPAGGAGAPAPPRNAVDPAASAATGQGQSGSGSGSGSGSNVGNNGDDVAVLNDAKIVRTGSLELQVTDVGKALTSGRDAVRSFGGYIGASQQQRSGDQTVASVTYRIPVSRWDEAMDALRGLGTVISEKTDAQEVTDQIVDLDARIRNLKASEQALVGYAEKAPKVSDLLEIQSRLTDTRGEIERLTAQSAALNGRAALATLTVTYGVEVVAVTQVAEQWNPAAEVDRASATLIGFGQAIVSFAIVVAIVWVPILAVIGLFTIVGVLVARRLGWRRPIGPPPAMSPPA
jgi:hypothetical protein